jgi:predicted transcriptional regulator
MRERALRSPKTRITIHFDTELLERVKAMAEKTSAPYQTLLNSLLLKALSKENAESDRLERLEREVAKIKKQLAS